jgi:hypothetical protein
MDKHVTNEHLRYGSSSETDEAVRERRRQHELDREHKEEDLAESQANQGDAVDKDKQSQA